MLVFNDPILDALPQDGARYKKSWGGETWRQCDAETAAPNYWVREGVLYRDYGVVEGNTYSGQRQGHEAWLNGGFVATGRY